MTVYRFDVAPTADPLVVLAEVECSSGTYVRSLAADLGTSLGGGAHLRSLRRTAIGSFGLSDTGPLEALAPERLLPPSAAMRDYPSVTVVGPVIDDVGHWNVLERAVLGVQGAGPWAVLDDVGRLLAVYEPHKGSTVKPAVVVIVSA